MLSEDLRVRYADCLPQPELDAARALCAAERAKLAQMIAEAVRRQAMGVALEYTPGQGAEQRAEVHQLQEWLSAIERVALGVRGLEAHIARLLGDG